MEFQYGISDCPVYPRMLYARFTVFNYMYVLKMKHEKHAKKVVKIVHMIIKLNEWLTYVYEFSLMQMII